MAFDFFVEDNNGSLTEDPILMRSTASTDSSGNWSVDMSNVGWTSVYHVQATCVNSASGVTNTTITSVTTFSTSTVSGSVYKFTETLGILNLAAVGSGVTVYITVLGSLSA